MNLYQMLRLLEAVNVDGWIKRTPDNWQTYDAAKRRGFISDQYGNRYGAGEYAHLTLIGIAYLSKLITGEMSSMQDTIANLVLRIHALENRHD